MARRVTASDTLLRAYERSKDAFETVAHETQGLYRDARPWMQQNSQLLIAVSSAAAGAALLGYLAGRRRRAPMPAPVRGPQLPAGLSEFDIAPFFKFLKLWMLYRVATRD
jgi:hypothetical protein